MKEACIALSTISSKSASVYHFRHNIPSLHPFHLLGLFGEMFGRHSMDSEWLVSNGWNACAQSKPPPDLERLNHGKLKLLLDAIVEMSADAPASPKGDKVAAESAALDNKINALQSEISDRQSSLAMKRM